MNLLLLSRLFYLLFPKRAFHAFLLALSIVFALCGAVYAALVFQAVQQRSTPHGHASSAQRSSPHP